MARATRDPWGERRVLLEALLKEATRSGAQITCPPGTSLASQPLLDAINPMLLIKQLQQASSSSVRSVDLSRCTFDPAASGTVAGIPTYTISNGGALTSNGDGSNPFAESINPFASPTPPPSFATPPPSLPPAPQPVHRAPSAPSVVAAAPAAAGQYTAAPASAAPGQYAFSSTLQALQQAKAPVVEPEVQLSLKQLETGLEPSEVRELAFTLFSTCTRGDPAAMATGQVLRTQLRIEPAAATDMASAVALHMDAGGALSPAQSASLEGILRLVERARPADWKASSGGGSASSATSNGASTSNGGEKDTAAQPGKGQDKLLAGFQAFRHWRNCLASVLRSGFELNVEEGWAAADRGLATKLLARLRGALRRMDGPSPADLDEEEYSEAVQALGSAARKLAGSCRMGWQLPWGIRVHVCEVLLRAVFDPSEPGTYVPESTSLTSLLERRVWPALSVGPVLQLGINAWVHFKQYIQTRDNRHLRQLKYLMSKVLTQTEERPEPSDHFGLGMDAVATDSNRRDAARDHELAADVARCIVDHTSKTLGDYYATFPDGGSMQGLLDVLTFASKSRGDSEATLAQILTALVRSSTLAELDRQATTRRPDSQEEALHGLLEAAEQLNLKQQRPGGHALAMEEHMPGSMLVGKAVMYEQVWAQLAPWLKTVTTLDPSTLRILHSAMALDRALGDPLEQAAVAAAAAAAAAAPSAAAYPAVPSGAKAPAVPAAVSLLMKAGFQKWNMSGPLSQALDTWVRSRVQDLGTWSQRQLAMEKWRAVSQGQGFAQSALEVAKMIDDALDALFGLGLPLSREAVEGLVKGADACLNRCASYMTQFMGQASRLVPPKPPPTRFKKDLVVKQEAEEEAARTGKPLPVSAGSKILAALGGGKKKKDPKAPQGDDAFVEAVPKINSSPDYVNLQHTLTRPVLTTVIHSAAYLLSRNEAIARSTAARWQGQDPGTPRGGAPVAAPSSAASSSTPTPPSALDPMAWMSGVLEPSRGALDATVQYGCMFLATRITFWDLRQPWLVELWRHHVSSQRIDAVLELTNQALGDVCSMHPCPAALQSSLALALLKTSVSAVEFVLLDGGPCRWFTPADVPLLEQDINKLRAVFHAEGAGLGREVVEAELKWVLSLLRPMALEIGPLMDLVKEARERGSCTLNARGQQLVFQEQVIMRILARRPDRTGSKLLKEKYKMSKRLKA